MAYDKSKVKFDWRQIPNTMEGATQPVISSSPDYEVHIGEWVNLRAMYEGIEAIVRARLVGKHERESETNWKRRQGALHSFNYTKAVEDTYNSHMYRKGVVPHYEAVQDLPWFEGFLEDCDYEGTPFETLGKENAPYKGVYGMTGYLVDMPKTEGINTEEDAAAKNIHPYVAVYYPPNILDWQFVRDEYMRPILVYIKLLDNDGYLRCYWDMGDSIHWEVYNLNYQTSVNNIVPIQDVQGQVVVGLTAVGQLLYSADTTKVNRIPFVPNYNKESGIRMIGVSDVKDIAHSDLDIVNSLSDIAEIRTFASFPIQRRPWPRAGREDESEPEVGATAIAGFDPNTPESKPDFIQADVAAPISAIWEHINNTRAEIFRSACFGGMASGEITMASGVSLKQQYQMLNARLIEKASYEEQANNQILDLACQWEGVALPKEKMPRVEMPKDYNIEELTQDLEEATAAVEFVQSNTFKTELRKIMVSKFLPGACQDVQNAIYEELENEEEYFIAEIPATPEDVAQEQTGQPVQPGQPLPSPGQPKAPTSPGPSAPKGSVSQNNVEQI
jgi:hypothetical protein